LDAGEAGEIRPFRLPVEQVTGTFELHTSPTENNSSYSNCSYNNMGPLAHPG
jgi:hypothetical protein